MYLSKSYTKCSSMSIILYEKKKFIYTIVYEIFTKIIKILNNVQVYNLSIIRHRITLSDRFKNYFSLLLQVYIQI